MRFGLAFLRGTAGRFGLLQGERGCAGSFKRTWSGMRHTNPDYSVRIELPCSLMYKEGERVMVIGGDVGVGRCIFMFRRSDVRGWLPPHEAEMVDGAERLRVIENIRAAWAWAGKEVVVE